MKITALQAFSDNYIWVLQHGDKVAVVDPGDATPVLAYLEQSGNSLCAILVTHHHADHIGGISELLARFDVPVYGPAVEEDKITTLTQALMHGDTVKLPMLATEFDVLDVGGHTRGHIAYFSRNDGAPVVFCGDTLFAGGCGRIFEGTPEQMYASLTRLSAMPAETRVYCAHEYTQSNLKFALAVEPGNQPLQDRAKEVARLRADGVSTVPSTLAVELATNPFLRASAPEVIKTMQAHTGNSQLQKPIEVFAAIREWKNTF